MAKRTDWRERARELFFRQRLSIHDTADEIQISRQTVASFLRKCDGFYAEKARRTAESKNKQKTAKRDWHAKQRATSFSQGDIEGQLLRREHFEAVKTLSYEKLW